ACGERVVFRTPVKIRVISLRLGPLAEDPKPVPFPARGGDDEHGASRRGEGGADGMEGIFTESAGFINYRPVNIFPVESVGILTGQEFHDAAVREIQSQLTHMLVKRNASASKHPEDSTVGDSGLTVARRDPPPPGAIPIPRVAADPDNRRGRLPAFRAGLDTGVTRLGFNGGFLAGTVRLRQCLE